MLGSELVMQGKAGMRVVAYWRQGIGEVGEVIIDEVDTIGIQWQERKIVGVYRRRKVERGSRRYGEWVKQVAGVLRRVDRILLGDWSAHHCKWSLKAKWDVGGVALDEAMLDVGAEWWKTQGLTWDRRVSGRYVKSRIYLIFYKGEELVKRVRKVKLLSDHWGWLVNMEEDNEVEHVKSVVIDWDRVDETVGKGKKKKEVNENWYWELKGETVYDKLLEFRQNHLKTIKIVAQSKRWWDEDLMKLLKKVRRVRRGGRGKLVEDKGVGKEAAEVEENSRKATMVGGGEKEEVLEDFL